MIHKVHINNFQSHKNTKINLNEHVNYVSGKSNTGKSSLYRAIIWCLRNEPSGDFFIRHEENDVKVSVWCDDRRENKDKITKITRYRSPSKNEYRIEGKEDPITGFRSDVPELVEDITGIREAKFSDSLSYPLNKSSQHESYFLLQETAGNITDVIGSTTGVNIVDHAIKIANDEKRELENERKSIHKSIENNKEKIQSLQHIEENEDLIEEINNLDETIGNKIEKFNELKEIESKYKDIENKSSEIEEKLNNIPSGLSSDKLENKVKKYGDIKNNYIKFKSINNKLDIIKENIKNIPDAINEFDIDNTDKIISKYTNYVENMKKINDLKKVVSIYENTINSLPEVSLELNKDQIKKCNLMCNKINDIEKLRKSINNTKEELNNSKKSLNKLEEEFENFADGKACPLCNQKIDSEKAIH